MAEREARRGPTSTVWRMRSRGASPEQQGILTADWEVHLDPMSDEHSPDEIDARSLLRRWADRVRGLHRDELIPISWWVVCRDQGTYERMPFQVRRGPSDVEPPDDFLSFFTWPVNSRTGQPINWLTLPVLDKRWNGRRADKGGFIQEATGWKPSVLQPSVYLPALLSVLRQR